MKIRTTLLLVVFLSLFQPGFGQKNNDLFTKRNEIYFNFSVTSKDELKTISRQISIDNFRNDTVWAYANTKQFLKFSTSGYRINILPHPGDGPGVVMRDQVKMLKGTKTTWNFYPTYEAYETLMNDFQTLYPTLCHLETITTLPSGRKIIAAKISDNVSTNEAEPEFLYTSSMHGDETTGYVLMLQLIEYLLQNYGTIQEVTDLVNNMEIYINPLANPDGTYYGGNSSVSGAIRGNANGVDLNRNYPDPEDGEHPDGEAWQPETVAFMNYASTHDFMAAANFHGGIEVVNYPWDTWVTRSADDSWWIMVSREYADVCQANSPAGYMDDLNDGITNGYDWYEVAGGRQDYMNFFHHCREFTVEISTTKTVPAAQLPNYWNYNYRSFLLYLHQATYGFRGLITDQSSGNPVEAKVTLVGHDALNTEVYSTALHGDYYRPVKAGTYTIEVSAPCYVTQTLTNRTITDYNSVIQNFQLVPTAGVTTTAVTSITTISAVSGGTVICEGSLPVTARGVCWSTGVNPTIADSHTTDGSGSGSFTSNLTGLLPSYTYHVRAYVTTASGTTYGNDLSFSTSCGGITSYPWTEGFENGGVIPGCWTQERVASSGIDWTFITGSGNSHPAAAHGGTYNACLKDATGTDNKTRLITPTLNLSGLSNPVLTFWHTQAVWSGDQDQLIVYYKTSSGGTWTAIGTYTASITTWTMETINLPGGSADYYIAFEGNAKYGYGVCLDDVAVNGSSTPVLTVTPANQNVTPPAGSTAFTVTSNTAWTAVSNQSWCTVTPSGTGNGTISATFTQNTTSAQRIANITVSASGLSPVVVTVTQAAPTLAVSPSNQNVTAVAGSTSFGITTNSAWVATSDQAWCTVTPSGTGNGTISAVYLQNTLLTARTANITVTVSGLTSQVVTVSQAGTSPTLSVTPASQSVTASAGSTTFTVTSNTAWNTLSDQTWCTVTPSGTGNGSITANFTQNTTSSSRTATITVSASGVSPVTITVIQAGAVVSEFLLTIQNVQQTAPNVFEFDIFLLDNDATSPFELASIQEGINFNLGMLNGGNVTTGMTTIVSGTSQLPSNMAPISVSTLATGLIRVAGRAAPGAGNGFIVSNTAPGTRIIRLRMTNSVAFASSSTANMNFTPSTAITPSYATRVAKYEGTINTQLAVIPGENAIVPENPLLNGPPSLSVSPVSQNVGSSSGVFSYTVTTNSSWTSISDQSWCNVNASGFGNGTIPAVFSENTSGIRTANITVSVAGLPDVVVTLTQDGVATKVLNVFAFLEGLYNGGSTMRQASDENGAHFGAGIADLISIELHNASSYSVIEHSITGVDLSTSGNAMVNIPPALSGSYYITVKNRNSIETTSASPVSFASPVIDYAFDLPSKAFGGNLLQMIDGVYVLYAGDVNQDGTVDTGDTTPIDNDQFGFVSGYVVTDINGDGTVDTGDTTIVDNNQFFFIGSVLP
ncbi:MAG: hypothetical protein IPN08_00835 [Bacteroidales bacterium]|nr:hypothetical protein [Bacteroidales bacterium]